MTDKELIKLSRENLKKSRQVSLCECYDEAFIKGYRLSEKRIAELEAQVEKAVLDNASYLDRLCKIQRAIEELGESLGKSLD